MRRAPQVMVKVTGGGRGMKAIAAHFRYISKNGRLEIEEEQGQKMHGKDALRWLADDWRFGGTLIEDVGDRREAFNIMLSMPRGIDPLPLDRGLPDIDRKPRVYVIGYPDGRDLAFSLQDNELLDHEGPPMGHPPDPDVCRLQYRAPTAPGSSGSPVFSAKGWRVVALHHAGSKSMPKLNSKTGRWPANEGIWIQSIISASRAQASSKGTSARGSAAGEGSGKREVPLE